jgi:hypothetical protein
VLSTLVTDRCLSEMLFVDTATGFYMSTGTVDIRLSFFIGSVFILFLLVDRIDVNLVLFGPESFSFRKSTYFTELSCPTNLSLGALCFLKSYIYRCLLQQAYDHPSGS